MNRIIQTSYGLLLAGLLFVLPACGTLGLPDLPEGTPLDALLNPPGTVVDGYVELAEDDCLALGNPATMTQQRMFDALNNYREERGLQPLVYSKRLEAAAQEHLQDMVDRGYFDHLTPEGKNPGERAMDIGFCHQYVGENLAAGQRSVTLVMRAWHKSESHQINMVEPNFVYTGMGYYVDGAGRKYWAQLFAYQYP